MNNNDILIGLRDALDIQRSDMVEIFKEGGVKVTEENVLNMLMKPKDGDDSKYLKCDYETLESFLNGLIVFRRGRLDQNGDEREKQPLTIKDSRTVNNVMLKKVKIALSLTNDDIVDIFDEADVYVTKQDLTPFFRKEGHKHYKKLNDQYASSFLKGLSIVSR